MEKTKTGITATWLSIFLNIALFGIKYWAGIVSNSVALLADAWHTLSDSVSSLAVLLGLKVSNIPADSKHPYGHGRAELIASLVVGILLAIVGFNFLGESVMKFQEKAVFNYGPVAIWVTVASVVIKEAMARYSIIIGKKIKSNSLKADGWHHRSDALSSVAVLLGVAGTFINPAWHILDAFAALIVSFFIIKVGFDILRKTLREFTDTAPRPEIIEKLMQLSRTIDGVMDAHDLRVRTSGGFYQAEIHIVVDGQLTVVQGHHIAKTVERCLTEEMDELHRVIVHVDPVGEA